MVPCSVLMPGEWGGRGEQVFMFPNQLSDRWVLRGLAVGLLTHGCGTGVRFRILQEAWCRKLEAGHTEKGHLFMCPALGISIFLASSSVVWKCFLWQVLSADQVPSCCGQKFLYNALRDLLGAGNLKERVLQSFDCLVCAEGMPLRSRSELASLTTCYTGC